MPSLRNYRSMSYCDPLGRELSHVDSNEAARRVAAGDHEMFCVSCKSVKRGDSMGPCLTRGNHLMAVRQLAPIVKDDCKLKAHDETDTSLTERDSQQNVGITEGFPGEGPDMMLVEGSRERIANWGDASRHDCRATTVVGAP